MKASKFTDNQILSILKQAELDTPVPTLCREHGMSSAMNLLTGQSCMTYISTIFSLASHNKMHKSSTTIAPCVIAG